MPLTAFKNGRADIAGCIKRKEFEHNLIGYIPMDKPEKQNRHDENRACFKKYDFIAFQQHCLRGVFLFQSSGSPAMTVCRMRRIPHLRRLRKGADPAAMYRKTKPRRLQEEAAGGVLFFQAFWISSSAICTQLVAAPLRTWSPQHQRHRPLGSVRSGRMRPTNTRS